MCLLLVLVSLKPPLLCINKSMIACFIGKVRQKKRAAEEIRHPMGVFGSFNGSLGQKARFLGVLAKSLGVFGSSMGVHLPWLHLQHDSHDSDGREQVLSRLSIIEKASRNNQLPYAVVRHSEVNADDQAAPCTQGHKTDRSVPWEYTAGPSARGTPPASDDPSPPVSPSGAVPFPPLHASAHEPLLSSRPS